MWRRVSGLSIAVLVSAAVLQSQSPAPIRGFSAQGSEAQRPAEETFRAVPKPENLREYMRATSAEPHHAGSPGSRKVADYMLAQFKSWGLNASIETFEALMPYPTERVVELVAPERYALTLKEPPVAEDPDSSDAGALPTFNAYSADGDVTAELVYVNYGMPEDYEQLAKLGVDVKGKIVIARYGRSWRGIKPKVAYEHGAVGCIIYSDPREDGFFQGDVFPAGTLPPGAWRAARQRHGHADPSRRSADAGHGVGAGRDAPRSRRRADDPEDSGAADLLRRRAAAAAQSQGSASRPRAWRGALPITYHVGAGPAKVHLKLAFDWSTRPLYNVIARIDGSEFPDEWIIHGNHHDAWVNGASDPTSGNVALMETARGLGELLKRGWRPKRTIILASWDGEEWGLLGSTEWAEKHAQELSTKAVAYINSDSTSKGWLERLGLALAAGVRQRRDAGRPGSEAARTDAVPGEARSRGRARRGPPTRRARMQRRGDLPIDALGSGSDYTAFLDHLTIASLNLGFGGEGRRRRLPLRPTTRSTGTRTSPTRTSPTARRCRGRSARRSCGWPTPTSCRSSSRRRPRRCAATRTRSTSCGRTPRTRRRWRSRWCRPRSSGSRRPPTATTGPRRRSPRAARRSIARSRSS